MIQQNYYHTKSATIRFWQNKKVLITGGTAGLGKAIALTLSQIGASVAVIGRTQDRLEHVKELDSKIITLQADISDKKAIYKISGSILAQLGGLDILINNASYLGPTPLNSLIDGECEDFEEVLQTNLLGPYRLTKAILPGMLLQGKGFVINISSDASVSAYPTWGFYSVSKAGLDHMTRIWKEELQDKGIRFISIDPGDMYTDMHLAAIPDAKESNLYSPNQVAQEFLDFIPVFTTLEAPVARYSASQWRDFLE